MKDATPRFSSFLSDPHTTSSHNAHTYIAQLYAMSVTPRDRPPPYSRLSPNNPCHHCGHFQPVAQPAHIPRRARVPAKKCFLATYFNQTKRQQIAVYVACTYAGKLHARRNRALKLLTLDPDPGALVFVQVKRGLQALFLLPSPEFEERFMVEMCWVLVKLPLIYLSLILPQYISAALPVPIKQSRA